MTLTRTAKLSWLDEKDKREGLKSLYYFGKFILGYDLCESPHRSVCDFVQTSGPLSLMLLPRGSYKTSIISQIYPIWLIIKNPDTRILLDSVVLRNSERNLGVIKNIFENNQRLRFLYGDFKDKDRWTQSEITVIKRTNYNLKEPTIGSASVDTTEVGPHWDVIIPDDLHNEDNSRNRDQIDKVHEHFKLLFSLLEPGGTMRVVGTRWADLDLYGRIKEHHSEFTAMEEKAIRDDGSLFFPSKLDHAVLAQIKKIQGTEMFSAQYQNEPVPQGENAAFHRDWFKYGENRDCPLYITVDPSISTNPDSDFFAIVVGGMGDGNELFIENYLYGRWQPYVALDKMFNMIDRYRNRVRAIGIEVNAFQKMLKFAFEAEMKKRNKYIRVIELHHSKSKEERILSLQPRYECGAVYHKLWMKDHEIEEELIRFPKGRRDDIIDACAALLEIIPAKASKKYTAPIEVPTDPIQRLVFMRRRHHRQNLRDRAANGFTHETLGNLF